MLRTAAQHKYHVLAGIIGSDYVNKIQVVLANLSNKDYTGDKVVQLIHEKICYLQLQEFMDCVITEKGNGFGSSGI